MQNNNQFLQYFKDSEKQPDQLKIGVEVEFFGYEKQTMQRISYEQIKKIFACFIDKGQWTAVYEEGEIIALKKEGTTITLEPGGQVELSMKPFVDIQAIADHLQDFQNQLTLYSQADGLVWLAVGYDPFSSIEVMPWMPKKRYRIMKEYLKPYGDETWHMMKGTCGIQCNFDYISEEDMIKKMKVASYISPVITALFANSPVEESTLSSYQSLRQKRWFNFDPTRKGIVDIVFDADFSYQKYIDYILSVTMLILQRGDEIIDMRGIKFLDFKTHNHGDILYEKADWSSHLSSVFPHARLKNTIETRTADISSFEMNMANIALLKGIMFDDQALDQTFELLNSLKKETILQLDQEIAKTGLHLKVGSLSVLELAETIIHFSDQGLKRVNPIECEYLEPLKKMIKEKQTLSDKIIQAAKSKPQADFMEIYNHLSCICA